MFNFLSEETTQYLISLWPMFFSIIGCLSILFITIWVHFRNSRVARKMVERETVYENLVKSVRFDLVTTDEIKKAVPPKDYPCFQNYLSETISTIKDIDVSAERKIAEVSGFIDYLKRRIKKSKKWEKALAVRVLSYFRDSENIPLFKKLHEEETFLQTVFAASLGMALCKDNISFRTLAYRLWILSGRHQEAILTILNIQGKAMAPGVHDILREEQLRDEGKVVSTKFLGDNRYQEAAPTIVRMLHVETSPEVLASCLNALRYIGDESVLNEVVPFLEHEDFNLRIEALHAVAQTESSPSLRHIEKCLSDENWWVRREAALAMAGMGKSGISRLKAIAEEENEAPRFAARGMLSEMQFNRVAIEDF
jgi:HEAT repeat protein